MIRRLVNYRLLKCLSNGKDACHLKTVCCCMVILRAVEMSSSDIDDLLKSLTPGKRASRRSVWNQTLSFVDNINKKPPPVQMAVGGGAGLCVGYIFTRTSKAAATALGLSLFAFQIYDHICIAFGPRIFLKFVVNKYCSFAVGVCRTMYL
ncbi:hypothetical protein RB195_002308 [Necator americanus]|uniref:FUN14 family protein n=1 Tax=Necator americanus TaxID=51031 RepID=A0ABR1DIN0_NECAM